MSAKAAIMVDEFNGSTWSKWKSLPGPVSSAPSCTSDGNGNVLCAATATNGNLQWSIFNGSTSLWSTPAKVVAALYSAPSCAEYTAGKVLCVARNASGGLAYSLYNGSTWSAFANLVTTAVSAPSCTSDGIGGVVCAIFTTANATLVNRFVTGAWQGFLNIAGIAGGAPDCTLFNANANVTCFAKAYNSGVYVSRFNGGSWVVGDWTGYAGLGGAVNDNASCTSQASGELVCGVIGALDSAFYADVYNGTSWSGWVKIGAAGFGPTACAPLGTGQVVCLVKGMNNQFTSTVGP